jgi:hypothetical protein
VVYRFVEDEAITTPVKVGPSDLTHTVIIEGLGADDLIVVGPYRELDSLTHEMAIRDEDAEDEEDQEAVEGVLVEGDGQRGDGQQGDDTEAGADDAEPDDTTPEGEDVASEDDGEPASETQASGG